MKQCRDDKMHDSRDDVREQQIGKREIDGRRVDAETKLTSLTYVPPPAEEESLETSSTLHLHPVTTIQCSSSPCLPTLQRRADRFEAEGVLSGQGG